MSTYINSQFIQTKKMLQEALGVNDSYKLSYQEWLTKPEDDRAALLFLNFYDSISLAWYKGKGTHTYEEDGVDEAFAICLKVCGTSVKRQYKSEEPKKTITAQQFNSRYIYNIMSNAFNSLNYDRRYVQSQYIHQDAKKRGEVTVVEQFTTDGDTVLNLFDTVSSPSGDVFSESEKIRFWSIIDDKDADTLACLESLLNGRKIKKSLETKKQELVNRLSIELAEFREAYYC